MNMSKSFFQSLARVALMINLALVFSLSGIAQVKGQQAKSPQKQTAPKKSGQKVNKVTPPENVVLQTSDRVKLSVTYFAPPTEEGKSAEAIPIILLHEWEGNRKQLLNYAAYLQKQGYAVIVPDLRGHGGSTGLAGSTVSIDAKKFRKQQVASVQKDIERCKKFLVQRNNAGEVNINLLSMVAVGQTSVLAMQWVLNDWFAYPPVNADGIKQGRDIKALVLISPQKKLNGISLMGNMKHSLYTGAGGVAMPMMIVWAEEDDLAAKDAKSMFESLEKVRPDLSEIKDPRKRDDLTTLYGVPVKAKSYTGATMMSKPVVQGLWPYTNKFFQLKVGANRESFPWKTREKKVDEDE